MLKQLFKRKYFIIVFTILFTIFSVGIDFITHYNRQTMLLILSYEGTNEGLNPDGTRFVISEIKSDSILDNALKYAKLNNYTVSDIKDRIDIYPVISSVSMENVRAKVASGTDYRHIPNEFRISYSQKHKLEKNHTITLLEALAKAYKENFMYKYVAGNDCLLPESYMSSEYEFVEIADLYINKINSMIAYLQKQSSENGTFRADSTGRTFGDIIVMLKNLRDIDVEKYKAFTITSGLAKNKDVYTNKLKYAIDMQTYDYEKAYQSAKFTEAAIDKYDPNITGVMFIPSLDNADGFYMNRTKTGIDYLTDDAYTRGKNAGTIKTGLDYKKYLINAFASKNNTIEESQRLTASASEMLKTIDSKMNEISKLAIDTDGEYLQAKSDNYIKFQIPTNNLMDLLSLKQIAFAGILGLLIAIIYVLVSTLIRSEIHLLKNKKLESSDNKVCTEASEI